MYRTISTSTFWLAMENHANIQILPTGEENSHEKTVMCKCKPAMKKDFRGKQMIIHNAFDGRHEFDEYESSEIHNVKQTRDA
ncbi:MAG: hypothetical protein WBP82_08700 [Leuconostoc mesenteroides]